MTKRDKIIQNVNPRKNNNGTNVVKTELLQRLKVKAKEFGMTIVQDYIQTRKSDFRVLKKQQTF